MTREWPKYPEVRTTITPSILVRMRQTKSLSASTQSICQMSGGLLETNITRQISGSLKLMGDSSPNSQGKMFTWP